MATTPRRTGPARDKQPDGTGLIDLDPWLKPYADALKYRYEHFQKTLARIGAYAGSLEEFSRAHEYFGFTRGQHDGEPGVWYREWAPKANALFLTGDFNRWDRHSHPMARDAKGVWSIFLPDRQYAWRLVHDGGVKVHVVSSLGPLDRIPAYIRRVTFDPKSFDSCGHFWSPPSPHEWKHASPQIEGGLRVYEAHVGMATEQERIGTFQEFTEQVLPRIKEAGYNAVQLMAVQEHPYYGSFGYHVSSFYAVSSRFGTPRDFKRLVDAAHGHGLLVLLDLVHSHSIKNLHDGLNQFDGTDYQYFHAGGRGQHPAWDSLLFDYSKLEVQQFLLSNVRYWLEEYHLDGFRFDGVTSMMYLDHGLGRDFGHYDNYLIFGLDTDAIAYLQLANQVAHAVNPRAITIAEDVSGMPGLCRPLDEGGLGFDYRLAMGIPDYWIKLLKEKRDEEWSMGEIYHVLTNRRAHEKHIAYAESHDQALVGDKTLAFWLMDKEMYWHMSKGGPANLIIDRGIALHKMIRLITFSLGGEAYLNFMGNEFGHPEWIDFPREGNGFSYKYARRLWHLMDDPMLRYCDLAAFDRHLQALDTKYDLLCSPLVEQLHYDEPAKLLMYRRGPLVFVFNFHPSTSVTGYRFGVPDRETYCMVLNTDDFWFGGHGLVDHGQEHPWQQVPADGRDQSIQIYIPARTAQVLAPRTIAAQKEGEKTD
ncbi:MAG: alpha amylase C-terminal domain-containing protein [Phycisphaerae bacterium]|nr:alpha amylase C-terminal domain-containing protein [Phycisphaerae bacterium]